MSKDQLLSGLVCFPVIEGAVPFWDPSKIACRPLYPELMATSVLEWKREQPFSTVGTKFIGHAKCGSCLFPNCFLWEKWQKTGESYLQMIKRKEPIITYLSVTSVTWSRE